MKFKLIYRGEVKTNPKRRSEHIHDIRMHFHRQLKKLYNIHPYDTLKNCKTDDPEKCDFKMHRTIGPATFIPLICPELHLLAELDVVLMHPELLGMAQGDIDNRMKTLLDALKRPQDLHEVPGYVKKGEKIFTLLDDDKLVTELSVNTSHFLDAHTETEIFLVISVTLKASEGNTENLPFVI